MEPDGNNENAQLRDSLSSFVHARPDNQWIFNKLLNLTEVVNSEFYRYDLVGFNYIQYTVYNYLGANYDFHIDTHLTFPTNDTDDLHRKLSFSLILSDSGDYTGGDFEIKTGFNPVVQEQKRGRVLAFPSWVLHRVTPIKTGARKSIVFWAKGPKFK
jgi:PKHD-type hydroxylase